MADQYVFKCIIVQLSESSALQGWRNLLLEWSTRETCLLFSRQFFENLNAAPVICACVLASLIAFELACHLPTVQHMEGIGAVMFKARQVLSRLLHPASHGTQSMCIHSINSYKAPHCEWDTHVLCCALPSWYHWQNREIPGERDATDCMPCGLREAKLPCGRSKAEQAHGQAPRWC